MLAQESAPAGTPQDQHPDEASPPPADAAKDDKSQAPAAGAPAAEPEKKDGQPPAPPVGATPGNAPVKGGPAKPKDPDEPAAGDIRIRADAQEQMEKGHYQARGSVELRTGETRIEADQVDIYGIEKPDGTQSKKVVALGNVVFIKEDERLAGDRLTMELDTGTGVFENARGYVEPGMIIEGKTIERINADTYRVEGGRFTACMQPSPRWTFSATSAVVHVGDKVVAKNVVLRVKVVPAFYFPYFVYPMREDQRATGFLFPHFGNSSVRGFNVGSGFFWAMGRSADQTFYADHYSNAGFGFGHELRWAPPSPSRGTFRTYVFNAQDGSSRDYDINWSALQALPGRARVTLLVRRYSNTLFQSRYQDNFNLATSRTENTQFSFQKNLPFVNFQAVAQDNQVFFSDQTRINRRLPSLRLNHQPQKVGKTGIVFGVEASEDRLGRGNQDRVDLYSRLDFAPQVSRPFTTTWLQVNPSVKYRYTRYGDTLEAADAGTFPVGPPLTRRFFETSVELDGPTFSRVFDNPGGFYSNRFKHVIGPEVTWTYRTAVDSFEAIPKFDGTDQFLGTNQVYYTLVQRLLAKRPGPNGKSIPFEFLTWRIGQTYYVQIADTQNEFDPNYSSGIFGPGGVPDHNSPISSRLRVRPTRDIAANFDVEYDVNFKQLRNLSIGSTLGGERGSLTASWNKASKVAELAADRTTIRNFVRGALRFELLPRRLTFESSANYDFVAKKLLQSVGRLRWEVQCCGFELETIQFHYNGRDERQFRFNIELANMGSIGNFLGDQQGGPGKGPSGVGGLR